MIRNAESIAGGRAQQQAAFLDGGYIIHADRPLTPTTLWFLT
jgi:hypothetical protein